MTTWLLVLLVTLATARITRLVTTDVILDAPRAAVQRRNPDGHLAYFVSCPWCVSLWVSAGVAAATWAWRDHAWLQWALVALAASYVTGLLATRVEAD